MQRRIPFILDTREKKLLGVCAGLGRTLNIDPTFVRIAFVAVPLLSFVTVWNMIVAYVVLGLIAGFARQRSERGAAPRSEYERMGDPVRRTSIAQLRNDLDSTDRRLMAIDDHLHSSDSDALAREIEALRKEKEKEAN